MTDTNWLWLLSPIVLLLIAIVGATWKIGSWKGGVDKALKALHKAIKRLEKKIDALPMPAFSPGSPLQLTEFGERISKEIEAKEWAAKLAPTLIERCQGKIEYEIQEICIEYAKSELEPSDNEDIKLKGCAFNNGITVETVRQVLGIELRDEMLKRRKP